jgi:alkylation response protein AidB-like acyl-CoA dehydrogenase
MDFALSDEQNLLAESLRRYLRDDCPVTRVRQLVAETPGNDGGTWADLCGLGLGGLLIDERHGGSGLTLLDAAVAAEALAWGVAPEPFLGSAVMAPVALAGAATDEQKDRLLPVLADGSLRISIAASELIHRRGAAGVEVRGNALHGTASMAIDGIGADSILVPADGGTSLALIAADANGVEHTDLATIDRTRGFAAISFDGVDVAEWIGERGAAAAAIQRMLEAGWVAIAADILGASERAIEMAVEYAKQREQFGRPIGSFQAVKHLCAEMVAELEPARSLVWYAAHAFDAVPDESTLMALHAKAHLSEVGPFIVRTATEVHGGIGFTDELNLHYWFKRVGVDRQLLGDPVTLREKAAALQQWA